MTPDDFIQQLEEIFNKPLKPAQRPLYRDKLLRFTREQRVEILNRVLEETKYFPKVSEIFKAATDLGFMAVDTATTRIHSWEISDCKHCRGEGRLCVVWQLASEVHNGQLREVHILKRILAYADCVNANCDRNEFTTVFRCSCSAGDASTIAKWWPRFTRTIEPIRYR